MSQSRKKGWANIPVHVESYVHPHVPSFTPEVKRVYAVCRASEAAIRDLVSYTPFDYVDNLLMVEVASYGGRVYRADESDTWPFLDCGFTIPISYKGKASVYYLYEYETEDYAIFAGHRLNFVEDPNTVFENMREVQPGIFMAVPRVWEKLYSAVHIALNEATALERLAARLAFSVGEKVAARRIAWQPVPLHLRAGYWLARVLVLNNLRRFLGVNRVEVASTGAAPISPDLIRWFLALGVEIQELWGMSELAGVSSLVPKGKLRPGSIGVPLPNMRMRIAEDGEIQVQGTQVFSGYLGQPEKTAETFQDGWLCSGDIGRVDELGYFYITDRKKDIIITAGGKNVTPSEWENQLKFSPYISDAVVIGDKRKYLTCLVMIDQENVEHWALDRQVDFTDYRSLTRAPEVRELIADEVEKVNARFARVEQVKDFRLIDILLSAEDEEVTPTMKLKRKFVEQKYAHLIEEMYPKG